MDEESKEHGNMVNWQGYIKLKINKLLQYLNLVPNSNNRMDLSPLLFVNI